VVVTSGAALVAATVIVRLVLEAPPSLSAAVSVTE
jgi:hypothetical protein